MTARSSASPPRCLCSRIPSLSLRCLQSSLPSKPCVNTSSEQPPLTCVVRLPPLNSKSPVSFLRTQRGDKEVWEEECGLQGQPGLPGETGWSLNQQLSSHTAGFCSRGSTRGKPHTPLCRVHWQLPSHRRYFPLALISFFIKKKITSRMNFVRPLKSFFDGGGARWLTEGRKVGLGVWICKTGRQPPRVPGRHVPGVPEPGLPSFTSWVGSGSSSWPFLKAGARPEVSSAPQQPCRGRKNAAPRAPGGWGRRLKL